LARAFDAVADAHGLGVAVLLEVALADAFVGEVLEMGHGRVAGIVLGNVRIGQGCAASRLIWILC
jgi:hypothetical protein